MKNWIRIVVAFCIVLVIGFTVWAFCFREKDEVQAYNRISELVDYKESLGIKEKLTTLNKMNYVSGDKDKVIDDTLEAGKSINEYRQICLSDDKIVGGEGSFTYSSYRVLDQYVDMIIEYYLPYTKASNVNSSSLSNLKKSIKNYISRLKDLNITLNELIKFQNNIEGTEADLAGLSGRYNTLRLKYRETLNDSSKVLINLVEYVDASVYSGNLIVDTQTALFDALARTLNVSTSVQLVLENDYAHDTNIVLLRIDEYMKGESIYTEEYSEYNFLTSYNEMFNNYRKDLNYIFSCKNGLKKQMAAGTINSMVSSDAHEFVKVIFNVLGYVGA